MKNLAYLENQSLVDLSIFTGVPSGAKALIWEVFFASRQRGFDLHTHFPWIDQKEGVYCFALSEVKSGTTVGVLVLRILDHFTESRCAMIGMVCVSQSWRGKGLSARLLSSVVTFATNQQIDSLLLWTTQPGIYHKHGFMSDTGTCDIFGRVTGNLMSSRARMRFSKESSWTYSGLPPFGKQLVRFESKDAELIVVETVEGLSLAEWMGSPSDALDLIETALPLTWNLNAPADTPILDEINKRGYSYVPLPSAERMVLHFGMPVYIPYVSILKRI